MSYQYTVNSLNVLKVYKKRLETINCNIILVSFQRKEGHDFAKNKKIVTLTIFYILTHVSTKY